MKISTDLISQHTSNQLDPINSDRLRRLTITDTSTTKNVIHFQREDWLFKQSNGHFIITIMNRKISRDWIWTKWGLKIRDKIRAIQALSCTLPTKVNKATSNPDLLVKRCTCGKSIDDDTHILNIYELNHKLIIQRQNRLVNKITKELKRANPSASIWIERHWRQDWQLTKPDINMIKEGHCKITELTCP